MEASQVTVSGKTYDMNHLGKAKKTMLRRKIIIEYIQSKPAGEYIKMEEFQGICRFTTYANAWSFIKRMMRDGVIQQHEGEKKKAYFYSVTGAVRVKKQVADSPTQEGHSNNPDINAFIEDMKKLGVEFSITITNKREK